VKILGTGDSTFDEALRTLAAGLRGLDGTADRRLARLNARRRVLKSLKRLRTLLDEQAPAIAKPRGEVKRADLIIRHRRLLRKSWVRVDELAGNYAAAGVPVRSLPVNREMASGTIRHDMGIFVPRWAVAIGWNNPTKLRAAKKDRVMQRAVVAAKMLAESAA
jgi:hypothetical protein